LSGEPGAVGFGDAGGGVDGAVDVDVEVEVACGSVGFDEHATAQNPRSATVIAMGASERVNSIDALQDGVSAWPSVGHRPDRPIL
jgi:hypothetical protein